mgnify:CR=1 FL=1
MRAIAVEVADLARDCGGVMSGEHGDGRIRGPLLERFFGPAIMSAFRETKRLFDPNQILNPGDIVGDAPVESITSHLRVRPDSREAIVPTWAKWPHCAPGSGWTPTSAPFRMRWAGSALRCTWTRAATAARRPWRVSTTWASRPA